MYIEHDEEGIEEVEYVDLTPVPDVENDLKNDSEKKTVQSKITAFFTDKKKQ